ncbi:MAG: DUF4832 domain-containing protein [Phycisphaerales bacterium]
MQHDLHTGLPSERSRHAQDVVRPTTNTNTNAPPRVRQRRLAAAATATGLTTVLALDVLVPPAVGALPTSGDDSLAATGPTPGVVVHRPTPTAGPDINPLKGWNSGWWRDESFASVGFQYLKWGEFEPTDDEFDWDYVEDVIGRPGSRDRHVILRLYTDWAWNQPIENNYDGPAWLLPQTGEFVGHANPGDPNSPMLRATKYNDPIFIAEAQEAIQALLERFQNDPRVFVVQAGMIGFWGEWHTFPRNDWKPTDATKASIFTAYTDALGPDLQLQVRYPDEAAVVPQSGVGYHNDYASPTPHGYDFGIEVAAHALWRNGPIGGEWPPGLDTDAFVRMFETDEGLDLIEQAGFSTLLPPGLDTIAETLPGWTPDGRFMDMHRRFGYTFQVREARHRVAAGVAGIAAPGMRAHVDVDLANVGIAPFYRDWTVELALIDAATGAIVDRIDTEVDIRELGAGETMRISAVSGAALDAGRTYRIGLRIMQPEADKPKGEPWALLARNVYVVVANELDVIPGAWDGSHALQGGWNIVGEIRPTIAATRTTQP